jgi:DNA mismatch endonuclease (patch repair protein)
MSLIRGKGNKDTELRMMALFRAHGLTGWRRQVNLTFLNAREVKPPRRQATIPHTSKPLAPSRLGGKSNALKPRKIAVDFIFRPERVAVFVDGCFWHRHPGCKYAYTPKSRLDFWLPKFERNVTRDREVTRALRRAGWRVVRVWECDLANPPAGPASPEEWPGRWAAKSGVGLLVSTENTERTESRVMKHGPVNRATAPKRPVPRPPFRVFRVFRGP